MVAARPRGAQRQFETSWLTAWALMATGALVFRGWKGTTAEAVAVAVGGLVKQRLIAGAVRLNPDSIRHQGAGGMLARVIEDLLEGGSGTGKSTLASLLTGLRTPESGLMLAGGPDYRTLGEDRWRRRVAYAPQSHENHIFSGSLAFQSAAGPRLAASAASR